MIGSDGCSFEELVLNGGRTRVVRDHSGSCASSLSWTDEVLEVQVVNVKSVGVPSF